MLDRVSWLTSTNRVDRYIPHNPEHSHTWHQAAEDVSENAYEAIEMEWDDAKEKDRKPSNSNARQLAMVIEKSHATDERNCPDYVYSDVSPSQAIHH
jgi:hypothetical protein